MAKLLRFQDKMYTALTEKLVARGFVHVNKDRILAELSRFKSGQPLVYGNEEIFVLNRDNGRPIHVLFVKKNENKNTITVLTPNPRDDHIGSSLRVHEQYVKRTLHQGLGDPEKIAEEQVSQFEFLASLKHFPRAQIHFHSRFLLNREIAHDDGYSYIGDIVRRALLNDVDVLVYTPHNAFELNLYNHLRPIADEFGIMILLASEVTMPILKRRPNGPHHIVIAANREAALEINSKIFDNCDPNLKTVSYFLGMTIDEMYEVLGPLRQQGLVITGVAHPVNFSEKILPIRGIGLFSAVDAEHISWEAAMRFAIQNQFIEAWNDSIYRGEMSFKNKDFKRRMQELVAKYKLPGMLSPNLCNLALALELEQFMLGQSFGSDTHVMPSLNMAYLVGGDPFGRGWTDIEIQKDKAPLDRRFTSEEIVGAIARGDVKFGATLFTEVVNGVLRLVRARYEMSSEMVKEVRRQTSRQYVEYVRVLSEDFFGFLAEGKIEEIGKMSK